MSPGENSRSDLAGDPRWQLVERIVATDPFRRSARFRDLLRYLAECAITNRLEELTETHIGWAVFGKRADYSPTEDSTVRVHVRQLRLKLHEYFNVAGRDEPIILEIPKGGFVPVFREVAKAQAALPVLAPLPPVETAPALEVAHQAKVGIRLLAVASAALLVAVIWLSIRIASPGPRAPWPLVFFANSSEPTSIVTADVNYGMINLIEQRHRTLQEYLTKEAVAPSAIGPEHSLLSYIDQSSLTSSADAVIAAGLSALMANARNPVAVRSARDLRPRDIDFGNFIFLGSPNSNPWVSEFLDRFNFEEEEDPQGAHVWKNRAPRPGEQSEYKCLNQTGTTGDDYADIAFLPGRNPHQLVLILQGCQQEGTESSLRFLRNQDDRLQLLQSLGYSTPPKEPVFFEALIRTRVIAGAPGEVSIIAARVIDPK